MTKPQRKHHEKQSPDGQLWDAGAGEALAPSPDASTVPLDVENLAESADVTRLRQTYEQKLHDAEGRVLRAQAELENFRRRARRESEDQLKYSAMPLMNDLVEVVDNLARAITAADETTAPGMVDGIRMVQTQLETVLEKHGCHRIDATANTEFDPHLHSASICSPVTRSPQTVSSKRPVAVLCCTTGLFGRPKSSCRLGRRSSRYSASLGRFDRPPN